MKLIFVYCLTVIVVLTSCNNSKDTILPVRLLYPIEIKADLNEYIQRYKYDDKNRIVEEYTYEAGYEEFFHYEYDNKNRIIKRTKAVSYINYPGRDNHGYTLYEYNANDQLVKEIWFSINKNDQPIQSGYSLHEYSSPEKTLKTSIYYHSQSGFQLERYYTYEYLHGLLIKSDVYDSNDKLELSYLFEYDGKNNPYSAVKSAAVLDRLYGFSNFAKKYNIVKLMIIQPDGSSISPYENIYEYNAEGYPIKRKEISCCGFLDRNETITYKKN
ncbi:hypothetical protein Q0590_36515 [Rhodocytophaga aerolata]|uniref:DUF4595 domain-containing protein n=1 Tax=Rhodocytophaga aerolata TaxID=455078 RepID=A0ABT8RI96_9BACT|nr:hypothetical protein [Rhodocytophaga aerolata]MDO1451831.1 hypothetical protein [Rhodocytophaga aerolata]